MAVILIILMCCCPGYGRPAPEVKTVGQSGLFKTEKHAIVEAKYAAVKDLRAACVAKDKVLDHDSVDYSMPVCTWYHSGEDKSVSCEIAAGGDCESKSKTKPKK